MKRCLILPVMVMSMALAGAGLPRASASVTVTLGNNAPGFADGDSPGIFDLIDAQTGQPAPFDQGYGSDLFENFDQSWTFTYAAQSDIVAATITFGIVDDDSGSDGDQVAQFLAGAVDLTADLNAVMTAGASGQYRIYTLDLPALAFAALGGGSETFRLALQGPVLNPGLPGITPDQVDPFNGATLIFSTLTIRTRDPVIVPEPSTLALLTPVALVLAARLRHPRRARPRS